MTYSQELLASYLASHSAQQLQERQAEIMEKASDKKTMLTFGELALLTNEQTKLYWSLHPTPVADRYDPTPWITDGKWEDKLYARNTPCWGYWQNRYLSKPMLSTVEDEIGL